MYKKISRLVQFGIWIAVVVIGILVWRFPIALASNDSRPRQGGEYNVPLASDPNSLDPAFITGIYAVNVANNLFDGLVEFDKDLNIVPAIAEIWKISRDHRTYTFKLHQGVKFHNGREVTAEDFIFSFSRILHPDTRSPVASLFFNIKEARAFHEGRSPNITGLNAPDPYTLRIQLEQPYTPFLSILAMANAKVIPKEVVGPDFGRHPVGTGPFRFVAWERGKIILNVNEEYFRGRPNLETLFFHIYPNIEWEKIFEDFEKGFLDQSIIPSKKYNLIKSDARYTERYSYISKPTLNLVYIGMNVLQAPLNDIRVRQAISYAVDTETIVREITKRGSVPTQGILPPGIAGFDPEFRGYTYQPEKARKLLAKAGYPEGRGIPPLEIWTVSKSESVQKELQTYKKYLAEVGIQLIPRLAENWKQFIKLINDKKAPLYYAAWYADYPDPDNFLYVLCHSTSRTNRMGYHNPQVDRMLEEARQEIDYMKRIEIYREIQRRVMEEAPLISQHVNSFNYLFQPWAKGVEVSYLGAAYIPFRKVWIDYKAVKKGD